MNKTSELGFLSNNDIKIVDIWHTDSLECRLKSPLYTDLFFGMNINITYYKLEAEKYLTIDKHLNLKLYPTLLVLHDNKEIYRHEGIIKMPNIKNINRSIRHKIFEYITEQI